MNFDCEGAEYTILNGIDVTDVQQICGEARDITPFGRRYGINDIIAKLLLHTTIDHFKNSPTTWLFYASKATG